MNDLKHAVADAIDLLDQIGFDVGKHHISLWGAAWIILVVLAMFVLARLGSRLAKRIFARLTRLDVAQRVLGEKLVSIAVWLLAVLVGIDILGIDLTALTVFSGAFGLAIGFGLQKTFGNLIAGIILLMDGSIKPGDVIAVSDGKGSSFGQVKKIGIRAVSVTTRDKREYLIPNENLMTSQVENWSYSSREVAIQIPVSIAYGSDVALAESLMLQAARAASRVLDQPEPGVLLNALGPSSLDFNVIVWICDPEEGLGNVRSQVLKGVLALFAEHGIEIPYPRQDIALRGSDTLERLIAARDAATGDASDR
ncbi:mechanosensitive ion channel family protein [Novosphingobium lentum]|uniref:mechanosensitive ion channel family protein n=1 Tax=Novosphingobium lentum TaxID=145287 RepID=UPI000A022BF1|nr:mechanosensitive ion channel domain-containing protein [Novosphingobium lentum]